MDENEIMKLYEKWSAQFDTYYGPEWFNGAENFAEFIIKEQKEKVK